MECLLYESLYDISNDSGDGVANFATSKNLRVKSIKIPHSNSFNCIWKSPDGKTRNKIGHVL
jgi:hypothetical protein